LTQPQPVVGRPRATARFPEFPAYGGAFADADPVPHLTIGEDDEVDALRATAEEVLFGLLPLQCTATSVTLLEELADGTWAARAAFPLGAE
jgi:hypothetical protein